MRRDPDIVYIPASVVDDRRLDHRDRDLPRALGTARPAPRRALQPEAD